jgi:hypothetical protein
MTARLTGAAAAIRSNTNPGPEGAPRLVRRRASGEPVVLFTQTANARSMRLAAKLGFTEVERFEAYGA